jgi:P-type conjugative transfer protein TrbJ
MSTPPRRFQAIAGLVLLAWLGLLAVVPASWAQWAVFDGSNFLQNTLTAINSASRVSQGAAAYARQAQQLYAQYQSISYQVQNLQRLDAGSVYAILNLSRSVANSLQGVRGMSYELDAALRQFEALYPKLAEAAAEVGGVLATADSIALQRRMQRARFDAAQAVVQISAVAGALEHVNAEATQLLNRAAAASGAHDLGQVQAAQAGLTQGLLMRVEQQLAVAHRLQAHRTAEEITLQEARLQALEAASVPTPAYTEARGRLVTYRYHR